MQAGHYVCTYGSAHYLKFSLVESVLDYLLAKMKGDCCALQSDNAVRPTKFQEITWMKQFDEAKFDY